MKNQEIPQAGRKSGCESGRLIPQSTSCGETPLLIRYANTPEGLLASRDLDAMRRFVLDSANAAEQSQRQNLLLEHATSGLAMWTGYTPPGAHPQKETVVRARLVGLPFLIFHELTASVQTHFDWKGKSSTGAQLRICETLASALQTHPLNVQVIGVVHARSIAGVSPLKLHELFKRMIREKVSRDQAPLFLKNLRSTKPLASLLCEGTEPTQQLGKYSPQAYILTALIAGDWGEEHFERVWPSDNDVLVMRKLLEASLAYVSATVEPKVVETSPVIQPKVQVGSVDRLAEAITEAQALEMAWFAQLARRRSFQFDAHVERIGPYPQWKASLIDDDGEAFSEFIYCYDDQWRPQEHMQTIFDRINLAHAAGTLHVHFPQCKVDCS